MTADSPSPCSFWSDADVEHIVEHADPGAGSSERLVRTHVPFTHQRHPLHVEPESDNGPEYHLASRLRQGEVDRLVE